MKRIGIAASKISKGNIVLYNIFVFVLATLFALLILFLSGFSIFAAVYLVHGLLTGFVVFDLQSDWGHIVKSCMVALAIINGLFILCAVGVNFKIK